MWINGFGYIWCTKNVNIGYRVGPTGAGTSQMRAVAGKATHLDLWNMKKTMCKAYEDVKEDSMMSEHFYNLIYGFHRICPWTLPVNPFYSISKSTSRNFVHNIQDTSIAYHFHCLHIPYKALGIGSLHILFAHSSEFERKQSMIFWINIQRKPSPLRNLPLQSNKP